MSENDKNAAVPTMTTPYFSLFRVFVFTSCLFVALKRASFVGDAMMMQELRLWLEFLQRGIPDVVVQIC